MMHSTTNGKPPDAEQIARAFGQLGAAICWTVANAGDDAKVVKTPKWQTTKPYPGADFAAGEFPLRAARRNPAVVCARSGLLSLDLDEGGAEALIAIWPHRLPPTVTVVSSPGKGHQHYRPPEGKPGGVVEFGTDGATFWNEKYLLVPPAIHPDGHAYCFAPGRAPWEVEVATLPIEAYEAIMAATGRRAMNGRAPASAVDDGAPIRHPGRHKALLSLAGAMRRQGAGADEIEVALLAFNERRCDPPHSAEKVAAIARDVTGRYSPAPTPVGSTRPATLSELAGEVEDFWTARPELERVRTLSHAQLASPLAALGALLVRVCASTPPTTVLPPIVGGRASLNLAVALVGASGDGKDLADETIGENIGGWAGLYVAHSPGSGQGLAHAYAEHRGKEGVVRVATNCLFRIGEIDQLVGLMGQQGSTLGPELRKLMMGQRIGNLYVQKDKRLELEAHSYRAGLLVGVQPRRSGVLLGDADAGTPQRFLWMPAADPGIPDERPARPRLWSWERPDLPRELPVCETARQTIIAARLARLRGEGDALDGHSLLTREKVAACLDLLSGRAEVSEEGWQLAGVLMRVSDAVRAHCVEELGAEAREANVRRGEFEGERAAVADEHKEETAIRRTAGALVKRLDAEWVVHADLRRSLRATSRPYFEPAIERLIQTGQAEHEDFTNEQGRPGRRYRRAG